MAWDKLIQLISGISLVVAQPLPDPAHFTVDDVFSYDCARSVATMVKTEEPVGPLFSEGPLLFTSLTANDGSLILLVNTGLGTYSLPLERKGVNRIRFEMITRDSRTPVKFYLSYMHGEAMPSHYFEYSSGVAPYGKDDLDYTFLTPVPAPNLKPHLEYAIHETATHILDAITAGKVTRKQYQGHTTDNCEVLYRSSPKLAQTLRRNIDELEMLMIGPKSGSTRSPASVSPL
jgi:hypothetical protein